jgi:NAD(P)-dependent dehydrogenase (short-subunit alcohol dehydrogenase family)
MLPRTPSFRLDGRRALVTGAGRGIGQAAACALADAGAEVFLAARSVEEIEATAAGIRADGGSAEALPMDVNDVARTAEAIQAHGPFPVLVNNAGTNKLAAFTDVMLEDFDRIFALNVRAAFFVAQAVARGLIEAKMKGSIIYMSSQMGHVGGPRRSVYCGTKHALEGITKASAVDLGPHGIRVNTICPTFIETPLTKPILAEGNFQKVVLEKIKLGRLGRVEDLMGAIIYLASDASDLVTGTSLLVDGGWTAD